jgi:predicted RNA binding protein YcfA (HicA-like mRNA interferase family)
MKPLTGKELSRLLERNGWILKRVQGSHHIYARPGSKVRLSVPVHGNQSLKAGLQKHLMKLAGLPTG